MNFKVHSAPSCLDCVRHDCCQLGHWKKRELKVLKTIKTESLAVLGDRTAELDEVCISATTFQCACYGKNTMKLAKV